MFGKKLLEGALVHVLRFLGFFVILPFTLYAQWNRIPSPLDSTNISDIASMNGSLFAMVNGSVYHSTDHGQTWDRQSDLDSAYRLVELNGLVFALTDVNRIWRWSNKTWKMFNSRVNYDLTSIGDSLFGSRWGQIFISTDSGATWANTLTLPEQYVEPIYSFGDTLFAVINGGNVGGLGWPIYYNTNGTQWNHAGYMPTDGGFFYFKCAATKNEVAIYNLNHINVSADHGQHWQTIGKEFTTFIKSYRNLLVLGLEDTDASRSGLFKLIGNKLIQLLPDTEVSTIMGFAADDQYAYVATVSKGIWRTSLSALNLSSVPAESNLNSTVTIYPNPASDNITIKLNNDMAGQVRIYNELGILRQTSAILSGDAIELGSTLTNGVYTLIVTLPNRQMAAKFVINR